MQWDRMDCFLQKKMHTKKDIIYMYKYIWIYHIDIIYIYIFDVGTFVVFGNLWMVFVVTMSSWGWKERNAPDLGSSSLYRIAGKGRSVESPQLTILRTWQVCRYWYPRILVDLAHPRSAWTTPGLPPTHGYTSIHGNVPVQPQHCVTWDGRR